MTSDQVRLVATSSARFGGGAIEELLRAKREDRELRLELAGTRAPSKRLAVEPPDFLPIEERTRVVVVPAGECRSLDLEISASPPRDLRGSALFRVVSDDEGRIRAATALYAEEGTNLRGLAGLLRKEGRLVILRGEHEPMEAFVQLRVDDAGVSYMIGGARLLF